MTLYDGIQSMNLLQYPRSKPTCKYLSIPLRDAVSLTPELDRLEDTTYYWSIAS